VFGVAGSRGLRPRLRTCAPPGRKASSSCTNFRLGTLVWRMREVVRGAVRNVGEGLLFLYRLAAARRARVLRPLREGVNMLAVRHGLAAIVLTALLAAPVLAIELGDPAPPLKVNEWVKGGPIDLKDGKGKTVYVIDFWATWCKPCNDGIPHLTEVQKKYKDKGVVVIGVTSQDDSQERVQKFVKQKGDKMGYAVAYEKRGEGVTEKAYMDAFKLEGIPTAFIIDKEGRIAWIGQGYPMEGFDEALEQIVAGKFDLAKAKADFLEQRKLEESREKAMPLIQQYFETASRSKDQEATAKLVKQFMPLIEKDSETLSVIAWQILMAEDLQQRDLELALKAAKTAYDLTEGKRALQGTVYAKALWETGKKKEAVEVQRKAIGVCTSENMKRQLEEQLKEYETKLGGGG
jgi:thiol-disulfide isomerase/thioredoxin